MIRRALEQFDEALQRKIDDARLCATFERYFTPFMVAVLVGSLALGGLGLALWLLGFEWAADLPLVALAALGLLTALGAFSLGVLSVLDVGWSAAEVVRDAVRDSDTIRRRQALPEAGQLAFPEQPAEGALSTAEDAAGRVTLSQSQRGGVSQPLARAVSIDVRADRTRGPQPTLLTSSLLRRLLRGLAK